jgi:MFS family permease
VSAARTYAPIIAALWLAEMASSFETAMILAALKVMVAEFGDPALVGWLVTGFLIVSAAASAVVGRLGDLYGRRRVLLIVLAVGASGSLISATADSFGGILFGRLLQGATGTILALTIGLVRENLPAEQVPTGIGLMISSASAGTALGLVGGGLIVDNFAWQGIFLASTFFCLTGLLAVRGFVPPSQPAPSAGKTDWLSGVLFAPGVTLMLLYLSLGKAQGWTGALPLGMLLGGAALVVWWVRHSLASPNPLIAVRLLADRRIAVSCAASSLVAMGALQITVYFSLLLQAPAWTVAGLGLSATMAGLVKLPSNITSILAGPLGGWLTGRGGGRIALIAGGLVTTCGWLLALLDTSSVPIVIAELIVISFGTTMLFAVAPAIVATAAPPDRTSEATGMLGVIRGLFMGIGAQLITTLLAVESVTQGAERYPSPFAFKLAVAVIAALTFAATLVALLLPRGRATATP